MIKVLNLIADNKPQKEQRMNSYVVKLLGIGVLGTALVLAVPQLLKKSSPKSTSQVTTEVTIPTSTLTAAKNESAPSATKKVKRLSIDGSRTVVIFGEISSQGTEVSNKIKQMAEESSSPIYILLDSPGGSVVDGSMVINAIESSKVPVNTICHSLCASMAAMIHQYGAKRYMFDRSIIMFHQASAGTQGSIGQMNAMLGLLTRYIARIESDVAKRQGLSLQEYQQRAASEYWLDSQEALSANVVDELVDFDTSVFLKPTVMLPTESKKDKLPSYVETRLNTFKWSK